MESICEHLRQLGDVEMDVALEFVRRLACGQSTYGKFKPADPRDFSREAEDEALDMAVYCAVKLHKNRSGK